MVHVLSAGLFAAALGFGSAAAAALPKQSWNGWRWGRTGPLTIQIGQNVGSAWNPYVTTAVGEWNAAKNIDYRTVAGRTTASTCGAVYGTLQLCNANYGATGWLGYTYVWTSGGYIVQATIKLNDYYFSQAKYNTAAWRAMTVCQELGNALGLQDSDRDVTNLNRGTCTDYTSDPTGTLGTNGTLANLAPRSSDLTNLNAIYATPGGAQLSSTTFASGGNALAAIPEPAAWATMLAGFGAVGSALRRRGARTAPAAAG